MTPGFYIAHHPLLGPDLRKVGQTGALGNRLHDGAYVTCWPPPAWRYEGTLETATQEDARQIESMVLSYYKDRRAGESELVYASYSDIINVAIDVAKLLSIDVIVRDAPTYQFRRLCCLPMELDEPTPAPALIPAAPAPALAAPSETAAEQSAEVDIFDLIDGISLITLEPPIPFAGFELPKPTMPALVQSAPIEDDDVTMDTEEALAEIFNVEKNDYAPVTLRDYQLEASAACVQSLTNSRNAVLQMACRTGKTPVACDVIQKLGAKRVLYLLPNLNLLRQTAQKLFGYGLRALRLVGSDCHPVRLDADTAMVMTTNITADWQSVSDCIIVSTYQSSHLIPANWAELTIFDECHRTCSKSARETNFNHHVRAKNGRRLFMTATPVYHAASVPFSMTNAALYGKIAYRYHLQAGIQAGHVNPFRLEFVANSPASGDVVDEIETQAQSICSILFKINKMLVFCNRKSHADALFSRVKRIIETQPPALFGEGRVGLYIAHSGHSKPEVCEASRKFARPDERGVMFNVRFFQEGVEIPQLDAIFYASPRNSPQDIVQSLCRPLNKIAGKPESVIFIPVIHDTNYEPEDQRNIRNYMHISSFVDALKDEDPTFYDYLLNPSNMHYRVSVHWVGNRATAFNPDMITQKVLSAVRHTAKFRLGDKDTLTDPRNVPWHVGFPALRELVLKFQRYPKSGEAARLSGGALMNIHDYHDRLATLYKSGQLDDYQRRELESLPYWSTRGLDEDAYPWDECMALLRKWMETHDDLPMLNLKSGGYIGFDRTAMETLSGFFTNINQGQWGFWDKSRYKQPVHSPKLDSRKKQLDEFCAQHNLVWRKTYGDDGNVIESKPTSYQQAYARFKAYIEKHTTKDPLIQEMYPGYPTKHKYQESMDTIKNKHTKIKMPKSAKTS